MTQLGKLTRRIESTLGRLLGTQPEGAAEPLDVVTGILRDVEQHVEPSGGGRRRFPFTQIGIVVLAVERLDQDRYASALEDLEEKIRERLREVACDPPARLEVAVQFARKPRKHWTAAQRVELVYSREAIGRAAAAGRPPVGAGPGAKSGGRPDARGGGALPGAATGASGTATGAATRGAPTRGAETRGAPTRGAAGATPGVTTPGASRPGQAGARPSSIAPAVKLVILRGTAGRTSYALEQAVIRVGRGDDLVDPAGRTRHNDIAFQEGDDEVNRTVARAQAHLRFDASRQEFRLFDDGSSNGTRVVRDAEVITVTPHGPRGVALASGDILEFGRARVRFEIKS